MAQKTNHETVLDSLNDTLGQLKELQKSIWPESDSYASMSAAIGYVEDGIYELNQCNDKDLI